MAQVANQEQGRRRLPGWNTVVAFCLGALSWAIYSYVRRLFGRPLLTDLHVSHEVKAHLSTVDQAVLIAEANVRAVIEERELPDGRRKLILGAGLRHFREPWARDFGFASFGLVELNEARVIRETLEVFLRFQRPDGQFPVKVHSTGIVNRYLHAKFGRQQPTTNPLRPKYITGHRTVSLDGNALLVIAALNYLKHFNDEPFIHTYWQPLKQALHWLEEQALGEDGLLHQGPYTDWADTIARAGCVHYTNVLYWKAVQDFAADAFKYGYAADHHYFQERAAQLKQAINAYFWRDELGYYLTSHRFDMLNSDGNLLAVAWGLVDASQANAILDSMDKYGMALPVPTRVTNRSYGRQHVALENRLGGLPHYHTSAAWLWLGAWHIIALARTGRLAEAKELLERLSAVVVRDRVVHEVYDTHGRYLSTFWYTSEAPLTWSAALIIHAESVFQRAQVEKP
jgi:glycogen debranching enzyme